MNPLKLALVLALASLVCSPQTPARAGNLLNLLPSPKELKVEAGQIPLTADSRIIATDPKLQPLA